VTEWINSFKSCSTSTVYKWGD